MDSNGSLQQVNGCSCRINHTVSELAYQHGLTLLFSSYLFHVEDGLNMLQFMQKNSRGCEISNIMQIYGVVSDVL